MSKPPIDPEISAAAAVLGRKGGAAGVGDCKRRSKKNIMKAVRARIAANKRRKEERLAAQAELARESR